MRRALRRFAELDVELPLTTRVLLSSGVGDVSLDWLEVLPDHDATLPPSTTASNNGTTSELAAPSPTDFGQLLDGYRNDEPAIFWLVVVLLAICVCCCCGLCVYCVFLRNADDDEDYGEAYSMRDMTEMDSYRQDDFGGTFL